MSINYKEINNELVNAFKDKQDVTLYMLGENNLKYLKDETYREFFLNVFKNSNVKTIYFCYKIPNPRPSVKWDIENFVVEKDKNDTNELCAFLTLIYDSLDITSKQFDIYKKYSNQHKEGFKIVHEITNFMTKMKKDNDIEIILKPYSQNIHVLNKNYWAEKNLGFAFDDTSDFKIYNLDENEFKHANNFKNSITNDIYPYPEFTKDELNGINFDLAERFKDIDIDLD